VTKSRNILSPRIQWTDWQLVQLRTRYANEKTENIANDIGVPLNKVYAQASRLGLAKTQEYLASADACRLRRGGDIGAAYRFKTGEPAWNKGKSYQPGGRCQDTQSKKGHKHNTELPLSTLRINADGYLERKTSMTHPVPARRWIAVHRLVWIEANGPVPNGHVVVFKPGMRTNVLDEITLDKVELISCAENMRRNSYHNYPKEIAQLIQLRGAVQREINRRQRHDNTDNK